MNQVIEKIEKEQTTKERPIFNVGDSVKVHTRVREGDKERIQIFSGIVIGRKGRGINENFTVRRISYGEGVERVFPIYSPFVEKIEVEQSGKARRAKLYYLRSVKGQMVVKKDDRPTNTKVRNTEQLARIAAQDAASGIQKKSKKQLREEANSAKKAAPKKK